MKKLLFGIFAHPDDEAFGPSGTLHLAARAGTELHLVCATKGEAGNNPDQVADLGAVRLREWQQAAALMGARSTKNFGLPDGRLANDHYLVLANGIIEHIDSLTAETAEGYEIELLTMEPHGISGHLDHIAISHVATYIYYYLRQRNSAHQQIRRIRYFCLSRQQQPEVSLHWLYMPPGYESGAIDEVVDVRPVLETKLAIMESHHSQREDMASIRARGDDSLATEHFLIRAD